MKSVEPDVSRVVIAWEKLPFVIVDDFGIVKPKQIIKNDKQKANAHLIILLLKNLIFINFIIALLLPNTNKYQKKVKIKNQL